MTRSFRIACFAFALAAVPAFAQAKEDPSGAIAAKATLIDINTASAETLMSISRIGEAYSKAIIKGRPYKRKDELVEKKIVPQATYDKIKEQIIAKQK